MMAYINNKDHSLNQDNRLRWVEKISYLMDEQFRLPGTNFRFGLDPVMNLIPFLGDMGGFFISAALVLTIAKNGASSKIVSLMAVNIILDATIGAIPVLGQLFDFFYKANSRNIKLLREHYQEGKHQGSGKGVLIKAGILLFLILILLLWLIWHLIAWVFSWF